MSSFLKSLSRQYLKKLLPIAKRNGFENILTKWIELSKKDDFKPSKEYLELLARMNEDDGIELKEIPKVIGLSYRKCREKDLFKKLHKRKRKGVYNKIDVLLLKEELNGNKQT